MTTFAEAIVWEQKKRIEELEAELKRYREREPLVQQLLAMWPHFTSQEMYGEMLRDGMTEDDFGAWEEAFDRVREFSLCIAHSPASAGSAADSAVSDVADAAESQGKG